MSKRTQEAPLIRWLKKHNPNYYSRAHEVREHVAKWLTNVSQTFRHYTSHGIDHSDEIINQISKILFDPNHPDRLKIRTLSTVEAYIVIVSAYLHDIGMVASEKDKLAILASDEWSNWIQLGTANKRWTEVQTLKADSTPINRTTNEYLADLQIRYLLAEFVRKQHHTRTISLMVASPSNFGNFAFGQPDLLDSISRVCEAHGLSQRDLNDAARFPEECDIAGEKANLKLLAILLRLGDLLDLRYDRACPLLLSAACPLPSDSFAHWSQYSRITLRNTSPDEIKIRAECDSPEEHRILRDWCTWLVSEVEQATKAMLRSQRHSDWKPPRATLEGPNPTITITPSSSARYLPCDWRFELEPETVMTRLITDVYESPHCFIRELIQNACDATRCKLVEELEATGIKAPHVLTQAPVESLNRHPIYIRLAEEQILNELSQEIEHAHVIEVEDRGIGMDRNTVESYLLQIGRSWYSSIDFRSRFSFVPTSRFGVGFLSVFGASDHVVIDTRFGDKQPLRLILTGPRNYLLAEKGSRKNSGTSIRVRLRERLPPGSLTKLVSDWCKRLEFPAIVEEDGSVTKIERETAQEFVSASISEIDTETKYEVKQFPVNRPGIEGELYVFSASSGGTERWSLSSWKRQQLRERHPTQVIPEPPEPLVCFNGIKLSDVPFFSNGGIRSVRLDFRSYAEHQTLSRNSIRGLRNSQAIRSRWEEILSDHLASSPLAADSLNGWKYKQALASEYDLNDFWLRQPGMVPLRSGKSLRTVSLEQFVAQDSFVYVGQSDCYSRSAPIKSSRLAQLGKLKIDALCQHDANLLSRIHVKRIFADRNVARLEVHENYLIAEFHRTDPKEAALIEKETRRRVSNLINQVSFIELKDPGIVSVAIPLPQSETSLVFNTKNPLAGWFFYVLTESRLDNEFQRRITIAFLRAADSSSGSPTAIKDFLAHCARHGTVAIPKAVKQLALSHDHAVLRSSCAPIASRKTAKRRRANGE